MPRRLHRLLERLQRPARRREQQGLPLRAAPQRRRERHLDVRRTAACRTSESAPTDRLDAPRVRAATACRCAGRGDRAPPRASARRVDAKGAGAIVGVASPHATNEDLFVVPRSARARSAPSTARLRGAARRVRRDPDQGREGAPTPPARARSASATRRPARARCAAARVDGADRARARRARRRRTRRRRALGSSTRRRCSTRTSSRSRARAHVRAARARRCREVRARSRTHAGHVQRVSRRPSSRAFEACVRGRAAAALGAGLGCGLRRGVGRAVRSRRRCATPARARWTWQRSEALLAVVIKTLFIVVVVVGAFAPDHHLGRAQAERA